MFKHLCSGLMFALALVAMPSCDKDTPSTPETAGGRFLITTNVVNADGASGVSYFQTVEKMEGSINNAQARPAGFGVPPIVIGQHIFVLPDYMGSTKSVLTHYVTDKKVIFQSVARLLYLPTLEPAISYWHLRTKLI